MRSDPASDTAARPASRIPGLDGLRALAAGSVVVYHVWLYGAPGAAAVDLGALTKPVETMRGGVALFFVLSGFLLFRPYAAAVIRARPAPSTTRYLWARALRILPAYWVVLIGVAVVLRPQLLTAPLQLAANMLFLQNYVPGFMPSRNGGEGILPAWSLAVEAVFYAVLPLLGALAAAATRRRLRPVAAASVPVVLLLAVGVGAMIVGHRLGGDAQHVWRFSFLPFAELFALGMAVAVVRVLWEERRVRLPRRWRPACVAVALGAPLIAVKLWYGGVLGIADFYGLVAVGCAALLALVVLDEGRSRLVRALQSRPLLLVGTASYSLFLCHSPVIRVLRESGHTFAGRIGFAQNLLLVALVAAVVTAALYVAVERPVLRRRHGRRRDALPAAQSSAAP